MAAVSSVLALRALNKLLYVPHALVVAWIGSADKPKAGPLI